MPYLNTRRSSPFDEFDLPEGSLRPLWSLPDFEDEKKVHDWCKNTVDFCEAYYRNYFQIQLDNLLIVRGLQWLTQDNNTNRTVDRQGLGSRRSPKIVLNYTVDVIEHFKSKLTRYRPAVGVYPANAEQDDATKAKIARDVLDYIWYENKIDQKNAKMVELAKACGEAFRFIRFNPNKGDLHPDQVAMASKGQRVPVLDSSGNPVNGAAGDPLFLQTAVRVGEVDEQVYPGYHVYEEPCRRRENINWCILWDTTHADYLKALYPDKADKITCDDNFDVFSNYRLDLGKLKEEVVVYELFHRSTECLEKGRYIKFTKSCILENKELPYPHGKLPYVYLSDIDIPDQSRGMSFIQQTFPIQHQINACASLIYKSLVLLAHPKIACPEGSTDINQLVNEVTIFQYSGGVPPSVMSSGIVPAELFRWYDKLEQVFDRLSGAYTMSHGEAPSGVRAAKALRVLEEQEDKRGYSLATKYNDVCLIEDAKMALAVAGAFYDDNDGRLVRILGRDNSYKIKQFKAADLSRPYDIRIESTTALSQSPAARIEEIIELSNVKVGDPGSIFTKEQIVNLLDLTADEQFKDIATRAYRCAQSENDDMVDGVKVAAPTPDEDLIVHWKTHIQQLQSREYKELTPPEIKAEFQKHIYITEYLMFKKGFGITTPLGQPLSMPSPVFQQQLMLLPNWPVYFVVPVPMMGMGAPMGAPGPGLPMGEPPPGEMPQAPLDSGQAPLDQGAPVGPPPMDPMGPPSIG